MMLKQYYQNLAAVFVSDHAVYWNNLSRLNNLIVILNISLFFLTGLISNGYYFTFFSVAFSVVVSMGCILPTRWLRQLWYYGLFLLIEIAGIYFLTASIVFWVQHSQ